MIHNKMKILSNAKYRELMTSISDMRRDKYLLEIYKDCSLNFIRQADLSPAIFGIEHIYSELNYYSYTFTTAELDFLHSRPDLNTDAFARYIHNKMKDKFIEEYKEVKNK